MGHCFPLQLLRAFNYREIVFLFGCKGLILAFFISLALKFKYQSGLLVKGNNVSVFNSVLLCVVCFISGLII